MQVPRSAPLDRGGSFKGIAASLFFQLLVVLCGATFLAWDHEHPGASPKAVDRRQAIGFLMLIYWGFVQWLLVVPMAIFWTRKRQSRPVKAMCVTSAVCTVPTAGLFAAAAYHWCLDALKHVR